MADGSWFCGRQRFHFVEYFLQTRAQVFHGTDTDPACDDALEIGEYGETAPRCVYPGAREAHEACASVGGIIDVLYHPTFLELGEDLPDGLFGDIHAASELRRTNAGAIEMWQKAHHGGSADTLAGERVQAFLRGFVDESRAGEQQMAEAFLLRFAQRRGNGHQGKQMSCRLFVKRLDDFVKRLYYFTHACPHLG